MSKEILVQASGLARRYGERQALRGLDLELFRGEILGLLGPNGAGKSTTLRILSGTLPPTTGSVRIGGYDLFERPLEAKRLLGYLPEQPPLYPDRRGGEYLRYCARPHGVPRARSRGAAEEAAERCGLGEVLNRVIGNLSKGYRQRVGIAQAIVHRPAVVILDEPTVGLDPVQLASIRSLIRELGAEHGVILSSHLLPEVQSLCARVVILNQGRPVHAGTLSAESARREVVLVTAHAVDIEQLRSLSGVEALEVLEPRRLRLRLADAAAAERVQQAVLGNGWGLVEWWPLRDNLEQLFLTLTHGEGA